MLYFRRNTRLEQSLSIIYKTYDELFEFCVVIKTGLINNTHTEVFITLNKH